MTDLKTTAGFAQLQLCIRFISENVLAPWVEGQVGQGMDNQGINKISSGGSQGGCCMGAKAGALPVGNGDSACCKQTNKRHIQNMQRGIFLIP